MHEKKTLHINNSEYTLPAGFLVVYDHMDKRGALYNAALKYDGVSIRQYRKVTDSVIYRSVLRTIHRSNRAGHSIAQALSHRCQEEAIFDE